MHGGGDGGGGHLGGGHIGSGHIHIPSDLGAPSAAGTDLSLSPWGPDRFGVLGVGALAALVGLIAGVVAVRALTQGPLVGVLVAAALVGLDALLLRQIRRYRSQLRMVPPPRRDPGGPRDVSGA